MDDVVTLGVARAEWASKNMCTFCEMGQIDEYNAKSVEH